jgi:hypothetical protein
LEEVVDKNTAIVSLAGIIAGTIVVGVFLQAVVSVWRHRHRPVVPSGALGQIDERLDRIEHAIDAMAVEVERISEGQRFTTRLLSDRREQEPARLGQG